MQPGFCKWCHPWGISPSLYPLKKQDIIIELLSKSLGVAPILPQHPLRHSLPRGMPVEHPYPKFDEQLDISVLNQLGFEGQKLQPKPGGFKSIQAANPPTSELPEPQRAAYFTDRDLVRILSELLPSSSSQNKAKAEIQAVLWMVGSQAAAVLGFSPRRCELIHSSKSSKIICSEYQFSV